MLIIRTYTFTATMTLLTSVLLARKNKNYFIYFDAKRA